MDRTIEPVDRLSGSILLPGDKSISHRGLILASMAEGSSLLRGWAPGKDVVSTIAGLGRLGVGIRPLDGQELEVAGTGWTVTDTATIDAGNSGTTMRLLAGALAGRPGRFTLVGDGSLSARPMDRVAEPLRMMGAGVELAEDLYPPVRIVGGRLRGIAYDLPVASAQVKGSILLAGLQAEGATTVREASPARDHTERLLAWLGVGIRCTPGSVELADAPDRLPLPAFELDVPGDFSSAAYWVVAACLVPEADLRVLGIGLNPSRTGLLDVLASMGAQLEVEARVGDPEPSGSIRVRSSVLSAVNVAGDLIPRTIDELPLVALAASQADGTTTIRGAGELRVKESDRISVLAEGLGALGASVEELPDGLAVTGPTPLRGARVDPRGDHRLALTYAVAGLAATGPVTVTGWECTEISYPGFDARLRRLTE